MDALFVDYLERQQKQAEQQDNENKKYINLM